VGGLFPELRQSLYTARQRTGRPADFGPLDALRLGTVGGARTLGRTDIGVLEPGFRADIAVWPGDDIADMPDPLTALVLGPDRKVRHLLVDGVPVVTDGQLPGLDLPAARRRLTAVSRRLDA
jgi:cytosine/adenosine deaminase-related metal-dependent hydrolase